MKNMSFSMTTKQVKEERKTQTRRTGWKDLKPGEKVCAIEKGQGLKKGEKIKRLKILSIKKVEFEPLNNITEEDVIEEGFPEMKRSEFIEMFCKANKCHPSTEITKITFGYVQWLPTDEILRLLEKR